MSTSNIGSVSHPAETGLLIPSDKFSAGVSGSDNHTAGVANAIKGEVKKKQLSIGWKVSCFVAHVMEQDLF